MDRLEMAMALIEEAKAEKARLDKYNGEIQKLFKTKGWTWQQRYEIDKRYSPVPKKSVINDNIKTARRLLLMARV